MLLENEISIFKKLVSRRKHEVPKKLIGKQVQWRFQKIQWTNTSRWHCTQIITDCGNLILDFKQLGLLASPPFLQTLGHIWNTKHALIWKKFIFGPLGNSPVLLLLSPGKTPLTTTVAKFLDTSVCGGSWCLDHSLSSFLVKFTQILESILLDNPHKAGFMRFSRLVVHLFLPHFFLPLNFLLTCLDTTLCEQPASLAINVCGLPSLWRVSMIVFEQLSDQQSSPWLCSLENHLERPFWRLRKPLQVFWVD